MNSLKAARDGLKLKGDSGNGDNGGNNNGNGTGDGTSTGSPQTKPNGGLRVTAIPD